MTQKCTNITVENANLIAVLLKYSTFICKYHFKEDQMFSCANFMKVEINNKLIYSTSVDTVAVIVT